MSASWDRKEIPVADLTDDDIWHIAINEAMEEWNKGLIDFQFVWNTKKLAYCTKHTVGLITICPAKRLAANLLGNANIDREDNRIISTLITVRMEASQKVAILCHELGHALGLRHREPPSTSCMEKFINNNYHPDMLDFKLANRPYHYNS